MLMPAFLQQSVRPACLRSPPRLGKRTTHRCLVSQGRLWRHDCCTAKKAGQLRAVSIERPVSPTFTQEAQPLRDYQIGAPYGLVCLAVAGLLGAPLLALAGAAVLGASWQSWRSERQQLPGGSFQHWFAGALLIIAYQLGALAATPVAHLGVRLLLAATILASALYGMSAAASPPALASAAHSSFSGRAGASSGVQLILGASPTGMPLRNDEENVESNEQNEGHAMAGCTDFDPSCEKQRHQQHHHEQVLATLTLANHAVAATGLLPIALTSGSSPSTASAGAPGTPSACTPDSSDSATPLDGSEAEESQAAADQTMIDQAVIDHAVHVAFEQERETMSELVTQAVEHEMEGMNEMVAQAVEQAMTDVHFDVKANFNTLIVITGVILYWRGVWTAWDELFGYGLWSEVGAIGIGLGIMLLFRLLKIPLAEGWPSG